MTDEDCGCTDTVEESLFAAMVEDDTETEEGPDPRGDSVTRWTGLLAPIGKPTGDGRRFAAKALGNRELPVPLKWQREAENGHTRSVVVGTIDEIEYREDGVYGIGTLFNPDRASMPRLAEDVAEAKMLLTSRAIGPSVDLDDMEFHALDTGELAEGKRQDIEVTKGRICAATLVPIPAFAEARPFLLYEQDAQEYADSMTASIVQDWDLPVVSMPDWTVTGWMSRTVDADTAGLFAHVTNDLILYPVADVVNGRKVLVPEAVEFACRVFNAGNWSLDDDVRPAVRASLEAVASKAGVVVPWNEESALTASARAGDGPPKAWFASPNLDGPTPLTITADGRVFGHLATWDTCHIGMPGACVTPPKSKTQYAYFHTGEVVTAEGDSVPVGKVTLGAGHADTRLGFQAAADHYDNSASCVAAVVAGEDNYGIWVSGSINAGLPDRSVAELRRSPLSGDWRRVGGNLELVAALAVNTPGFPVPRARMQEGRQLSLVAAGALHVDEHVDEHVEAHVELTVAQQVAVEMKRQRRAQDLAGSLNREFAGLDLIRARTIAATF